MVETSPEKKSESGSSAMRYVWIGVPLVIAVVLFFVIFFPQIELTIAINGLHSQTPAARAANIEKLKTYPDKDLVIEMLVEAVQDDDRSFSVRLTCAGLLLNHFDRIGKLDGLLRTGGLSTRAAVLKTLSLKPYFERTYADDPSYEVRETVKEWLARPGDLTRVYAIQMAVKLQMREHGEEIRKLLARSGAPNVHAKEERDLMIAAAGAMRSFEVCEAVPAMLAQAGSDSNLLVRLRFMQIVDEMAFRKDRELPCAGAVPEADMLALVQKSLDDPTHEVRMAAELILVRRPEWAQGVLPRVREIVTGDYSGAERRHALEVLIAAGSPEDQERVPGFFHDTNAAVRTTAANMVKKLPDLKLEGCLIGLVGAEVESEQLFENALKALYRKARKWVGFPQSWSVKAAADPAEFRGDLRTLFTRGAVDEVTRDAVAEAWFGWWSDHLGLTTEQKTEALGVRKAFWAAMDNNDKEGAEAALAGLTSDTPGLFSYERAWLQSRR